MYEINTKIKVVKTDQLNKKYLGKTGVITRIVKDEDDVIYDIHIQNFGLVTFLEDQVMVRGGL